MSSLKTKTGAVALSGAPGAGPGPLAGAMLVFLALGVSGCHGCEGGKAHTALIRAARWKERVCKDDDDCKGAVACPPEAFPGCLPTQHNTVSFCACWPYRRVPNPDGGYPITEHCVRNPDGGTPICGEWGEGGGDEILGEDGGLIVDVNGRIL